MIQPGSHRVLSRALIVLALIAAMDRPASADKIMISSGGAALTFDRIRVKNVEGGQIHFYTSGGNLTSRPMSQIARIVLDDEPVFSAAEEAFAAGEWEKATSGYQQAIKRSRKEWVRDWSAARLAEAAGKSGNFVAAVEAWLTLAEKNPEMGAQSKPALPAAGSGQLDNGAKLLERALNDAKLPKNQQNLFYTYLLEIQRQRGDTKALNETLEKMIKSGVGDLNDPAAKRAYAEMKVSQARAALDAGKVDQALAEINDNKGLFVEPAQQAQAMYVLAEASYAKLGEKPDPAALKDAALAYMRVVANFKDLPDRPHVADSLLKTAQIQHRLGDDKTAAAVCQQIIRDFPGDPAAGRARELMREFQAPK